MEPHLTHLYFLVANTEWYKGTINRAEASDGTYDVEYDDGELDQALFPKCVRRFRPYRVNERIEVRVSEDEFAEGLILQINDDKTLNVRTNGGMVMNNVEMGNIRRFSLQQDLASGTAVLAKWQGGDEYFPAKLASKISVEGTYAVQYDDGDFDPEVSAKDIKLH